MSFGRTEFDYFWLKMTLLCRALKLLLTIESVHFYFWHMPLHKATCKSDWMWQKKIDDRINDDLAALSIITHDECARHQTFEIPQECSGKLYLFDHNTPGLSRIYTTRESECHPHVQLIIHHIIGLINSDHNSNPHCQLQVCCLNDFKSKKINKSPL